MAEKSKNPFKNNARVPLIYISMGLVVLAAILNPVFWQIAIAVFFVGLGIYLLIKERNRKG